MCIIVAKPATFSMPDEDTLRRCFASNPDGAGFGWSTKEKVYWKKGYLTFDAFYTALKEVFPNDDITKQHAIVLHFRIGTHGPKNTASHTHPFPVDADNLQATCELEGSCQMALFHNGIIHGVVKSTKEQVLVADKLVDPSDSQILAQLYVKPMLNSFNAGFLNAETFNMFMDHFIDSSRIALLETDNAIAFYGSWVQSDPDFQGILFSNSNYKKPAYVAPTTYRTPYNWEKDYEGDWYKGSKTSKDDAISWDEPIWPNEKVVATVELPSGSFWESCNKFPAIFVDDLYKLPSGCRVTSTKIPTTSTIFTPCLDGDLYMRKVSIITMEKLKHINAVIFVNHNGKYYMIGRYTVSINKEEVLEKIKLESKTRKSTSRAVGL